MTLARPSPPMSALTEPYWAAAAAGRLDIQRCGACGTRPFPPRRTCPTCGGDELAWHPVTGRGTVYTFTVAHRAPHPAFVDELPLVVAVVELDEGPRLTSNIVHCDPETVTVGMPVQLTFLALADDVSLPVFEPSSAPDLQP